MREAFEKNLHQLNETIKEDFVKDDELQALLSDLSQNPEGQERILHLQKEKQAIMVKLKQDLTNIEKPEQQTEKSQKQRKVWMEDDKMYVENQEGQQEAITKGEILTDGDWGLQYDLDSGTMPRYLRKKYLIEVAKRQLRDLLDQQIALNQESFGQDSQKILTYENVRERLEDNQETKQAGLIAEKLVKNFLKKLSYDHNLDFQIIETDAYQDIEEKIDFLILRRPHFRGINVEPLEQNNEAKSFHELGIQFTINPRQEVTKRKTQQIEKSKQRYQDQEKYLEDIVLVQIDMKDLMKIFHRWQEKKQAGGPDKLLSKELKQKIFFKVLKGVFSEAELQEAWRKV